MRSLRYLLLGLGLVLTQCLQAGAEGVPLTVYYRVLMIKTDRGLGTGFTLDVDGRQYLVTARHMVKGLEPETTVSVARYDASGKVKYVDYRMKVLMCDDPVDIAVLIPPEQLTLSTTLEPAGSGNSPLFGQELYFVGFPFGRLHMETTATPEIVLRSPFAYIRRAILSSMNTLQTRDKTTTEYMLDGYNMGGFSGSPVVYYPRDGASDMKVVAVICSYTTEYGPVLTPKKIRREQATPEEYGEGRIREKDGHTYRLEEPKKMKDKRYVILNTAITHAYDIRHAVDLIHQHPDGPRVDANFMPPLAR